jgi:hypothetical protein
MTQTESTDAVIFKHLFSRLLGEWQGTTKTWFEPGKLADESPWQGTFKSILDGRFLLYEYTGSLQGEPLAGAAILGYNQLLKRCEMAWVDSAHNGSAIMFSPGEAGKQLFSVLGSYPDPSGGPAWGWRTTIEVLDDDHLVITHDNITPQGLAAPGVQTVYSRLR